MFFWMQQKCVELYVQCDAGEMYFRLNIDFDTVNYLSPFNLINFSLDILCYSVCVCGVSILQGVTAILRNRKTF